ncbi:MAG: hypothetical protein AB7F40_11580 [Victivallaceae bacterium]|nr:hypothetical protein [Victivallaceae bacterium]
MRQMIVISVIAAMILTFGCGDESVSKKAGKTVGNSLREFGEGAGSAMADKQNISLVTSDAFDKAFEFTVARSNGNFESGNTIEIYIITKVPGNYTLRLKAKNSYGNEVGRATVSQEFKPDSAGYVNFEFPKEMGFDEAKIYQMDIAAPQAI